MIHLKVRLEQIYSAYNKRAYVDPDPLLFLYEYPDKKNREIVGFIAACFAYGRVDQIMKTVSYILTKLTPTPYDYLTGRTKNEMADDFKGFRYRFAGDAHLLGLLWGIRQVLSRFGSLEDCFYEGMLPDDETVLPGLIFLSDQIISHAATGHLLADPKKKSACKRSHLFLRWMVRKDSVDPGGWKKVRRSQLIIPLDTHMHKIGMMLNFTRRKSPDMKTALEITQGFKQIVREDPVKFDFCLTRFGIRGELTMEQLRKNIYS